jgi:hypothetical protein
VEQRVVPQVGRPDSASRVDAAVRRQRMEWQADKWWSSMQASLD